MGEEEQYPSYVGIKCPKCGSTEYKVVDVKKSTLEKAALIRQHSFRGVRANLAASDACENDFDLKLIEFKCLNCKKKFDSYPNIAGSDEILDEPCTIKFIRPSSFLGKALLQQVFLKE